MLHIQAPVLLKIRDNITVNLTMTSSHAIEKDLPQRRLKKDFPSDKDQRQAKQEDYEEYAKADTVSFWFIGGASLAYRVGFEITQEDFDRIQTQMNSLQFRPKDDRKPSDNKVTK